MDRVVAGHRDHLALGARVDRVRTTAGLVTPSARLCGAGLCHFVGHCAEWATHGRDNTQLPGDHLVQQPIHYATALLAGAGGRWLAALAWL